MTILEDSKDMVVCAGVFHIIAVILLGIGFGVRVAKRRQTPGYERYVEYWIRQGYYTLGEKGLVLNHEMVNEWNEKILKQRKKYERSGPGS